MPGTLQLDATARVTPTPLSLVQNLKAPSCAFTAVQAKPRSGQASGGRLAKERPKVSMKACSSMVWAASA